MNWNVFSDALIGSLGLVLMTVAVQAAVSAAMRGKHMRAGAYGFVVIVLFSAMCGWMASP